MQFKELNQQSEIKYDNTTYKIHHLIYSIDVTKVKVTNVFIILRINYTDVALTRRKLQE
jgi:hypothetical protein